MPTNAMISLLAGLLALSPLAAAAPQHMPRGSTPELTLTAQLRLTDSAVDRYQLLPNDEDFIFDFNKTDGTGFADAKTFPALVGTGASMAVAEVPACGMVPLHLQPRSPELFVVVSGRLLTETVPETGVLDKDGKQRVIRTELGPGKMAVFPMGSFHTQVNPDCKPALAVAGFTSEDPGAGAVVSQALSLSDGVVAGSFGMDADKLRDGPPKGALVLMEECAKKCGLEKRQV